MDIFAHRIVPLVVINDHEDAHPLGEALVAAGLPIAEVSFRTEAAAESVAIMSEIEGLTVGAGTIVTAAQVELAVEAGADFLVSPGLRSDIVREAQLAGRRMIPGAVTPGELMAALALGIDTVKFFPANLYGGPAAIEALAGPFNTMKFLPMGGISPENLGEYLSLECVPAVCGSWMVPTELIEARDFEAIYQLCLEAVDMVASAQN